MDNREQACRTSLAVVSRRVCIAIAFLALILTWLTCSSPLSAEERVYVENTDSGDLSVISVPRLEVISTIKIGTYPDDVIASHDGRIVYANRVQSMGHPLSKR